MHLPPLFRSGSAAFWWGACWGFSLLAGLQAAPPANDGFAQRIVLTSVSVDTSGSNLEATAETGEPLHAGSPAAKSVWWQWTAPQAGRVTVDTTGSAFDTVVAVYLGPDFSRLLPIAANDEAGMDSTSQCVFYAIAGVTYYVAVDGWSGAAGGIRLRLNQTASTDLYATDFESYPVGANQLPGREGWRANSLAGSTGIVQSAIMGSVAAYVGYNPTTSASVSAGRPIGYYPLNAATGRVKFSVDVAVVDSTNGKRDDFAFVLYNVAGQILAAIDLYNVDSRVYRYDGSQFIAVGTFIRNQRMTLSVTFDLSANRWSATLGNTGLFFNEAINSGGRELSIGMIAPTWGVSTTGSPGDNYLLFDNYRVALETSSLKFVLQPSAPTVPVGQPAAFFAYGAGQPAPQLQWEVSTNDGLSWVSVVDSTIYQGATTPSLSISRTGPMMDGQQFRLKLRKDSYEVAYSAVATLRVVGPVVITRYLRTLSRLVGESATFTVEAAGATSPTYQWQHNGRTIPGATQASYTLPGVSLADRGWLRVQVSDGAGSASSVAHLQVAPLHCTVAAWVRSGESSTAIQVPSGLADIVAVAAGVGHALALTSSGRVLAWGGNVWGECAVPTDLTDVVAIAAGYFRSYALKSDGTVVAWGQFVSGTVAVPAGLANVVAIGPGVALLANGRVLNWSSGLAVPADLDEMVAIPTGGDGVALRADGTVANWRTAGLTDVAFPAGLSRVTAVSANQDHALALREDGTVVGWGRRNLVNAELEGLTNVAAISAGGDFSLFLGRDGVPRVTAVSMPIPAYAQGVVAISAGGSYSLALVPMAAPVVSEPPESDSVAVGANVELRGTVAGIPPITYRWLKDGQPLGASSALGSSSAVSLLLSQVQPGAAGSYVLEVTNSGGKSSSEPAIVQVAAPPTISVRPLSRLVTAGSAVTISVGATDPTPLTYEWRCNTQTLPGATTATLTIQAVDRTHQGFYEVRVWNAHGGLARSVFRLDVVPFAFSRTRLVGWGGLSPPAELYDVVAASACGHGLALRQDGTVTAWGTNYAGESTVPAGLREVVAVAAGELFSLAIKADGTLVKWGGGLPDPAGTFKDLVAVSAANYSLAFGLRANGKVVALGSIASGAPVTARFGALSVGGTHVLARTVAGDVVAWGSDYYGQVTIPSGLGPVLAVAAGDSFSLALRADQSVASWGRNSYLPTTVPAELSAGVIGIAAGRGHGLALKSDGRVFAWGDSSAGRLNVPDTLTRALVVAAGADSSLAIAAVDAPTLQTFPRSQSIALGGTVTFTAGASGTAPFTYQWFKNAGAIPGATGSSLELANVTRAEAGEYTVRITNAAASILSPGAILSVNAQNLVAAQAMMALPLQGAFTVEGPAAKQLLVRAIGPGLAAFGVTDFVPDPTLRIVRAATDAEVAANNDWEAAGNAVAIAGAAAQVGAYPLSAGSRDAAVLAEFAPGTYRVSVGPAGSTGKASLEVYDADQNPRLVYLATLAQVGPAGLDQGVNLRATAPDRSYLIRALGPSLGSPGALADPLVTVYAGATPVAANDNWGANGLVQAAGAGVGALPLGGDSREAALLFTPTAAGTYTVKVGGAGGASGLVLLEIFEVDPQRAATLPLALVALPASLAVRAGQAAGFGVVAVGRPLPQYQWIKDGVCLPVFGNVLELPVVQLADAGAYTVRVTSGSSVVEAAATLAVTAANHATQAVAGRGYVAGGTVTIRNTLHYVGAPSALGWSLELPAGWTYAGAEGTAPGAAPAAGASGNLAWTWSVPPPSPVSWSLLLNVPASETTPRSLVAVARVGTTDVPVAPSPLTVTWASPHHSGDTDRNNRISLLELTRMIELYNTRNGTTRTGAYRPEAGGEDGFGAEATRPGSAVVTLGYCHSADTNRDGKLSLLELTRVIELYNTRSGTTRTGQYHVQAGTEDGYAAGP